MCVCPSSPTSIFCSILIFFKFSILLQHDTFIFSIFFNFHHFLVVWIFDISLCVFHFYLYSNFFKFYCRMTLSFFSIISNFHHLLVVCIFDKSLCVCHFWFSFARTSSCFLFFLFDLLRLINNNCLTLSKTKLLNTQREVHWKSVKS